MEPCLESERTPSSRPSPSGRDVLSEREAALQANELLALAPVPLLHELAESATECSFASGDFVYGRDEVAQDVFVLLEGRVAYPEFIGWIKEEDAPDLRIASRCGQAFGFAGALMGYERRAVSAICELPTRVLRLNGESIARACTAYACTGILEDLVRAHVRYERLGEQRGWQRLRGNQWRIAQMPLVECLRPLPLGGICVLVLPEDASVAADRWRRALTLGAITAPAALEADGVVHAPALQDTRSGKRGEQARRVAEDILSRHALTSVLEQGPQAWSASERLQLQLLESWFGSTAAGVVALGDELSGLDADARQRVFDFARRVGRDLRATLYIAASDLDEAFSVGDRVVLPGHGADAACVAIDLIAEQPATGKRLRALRIPDRGRGTAAPGAALVRPAPATAAAAVADRPRTESRCRNRLWEGLQSGRFFWTVEFIPSHEKPLRGELERLSGMSGSAEPADERMAGFAVTDRVHSDYDPDPVSAALYLKERCHTQPLVHLSGKGRELYDLNEALCRVDGFGLENVLLLSGDRLKNEPTDRRARYLESVCAIQTARKGWPHLHIGAALNPFKYREEDAMAQYLKLGKKLGCGADFIITQLGYDMDKYDEARAWMDFRGYETPLIANLMLLNAARGRWIRRQCVPGIVVSDSLQTLLEEEQRSSSDKGRGRALDRLAMQMVGLRMKGFNGIQLTGVHDHKQLQTLGRKVELYSQEYDSEERWRRQWQNLLTAPGSGTVADPAPGTDVWRWRPERVQPHGHGSGRYRLMERVHRSAFDHGPVAGALGAMVRGISPDGVVGRLLKGIEAGIKGPLFGCESCGMCRLAATQYVCPETCPKGLANGPCGGTDGNRCEFGDRECIHSGKYRIARDAGILNQLETWIVPAVPAARRGAASWPAHFAGNGPQIEVVAPFARNGGESG